MFPHCPRPAIIFIALSVFMAGCVVSPNTMPNRRRIERSQQYLGKLRSTEFVPTKPIELHEAMARAVTFNLRYRVAESERDIANAELVKIILTSSQRWRLTPRRIKTTKRYLTLTTATPTPRTQLLRGIFLILASAMRAPGSRRMRCSSSRNRNARRCRTSSGRSTRLFGAPRGGGDF